MMCILSAWSRDRTREFIISHFMMSMWSNTSMQGVFATGQQFRVFLATDPRDIDTIRGHTFESVVQLGHPDPVCVEVAKWCVR